MKHFLYHNFQLPTFIWIVGAENPVLMFAPEQIFSAGGKRMRPALVFY
ncbi:putative all-trans-nonaprenyl-diphosphate synthase (geranylgeranyl-diphosphate specific) [Helianthus anomalus]